MMKVLLHRDTIFSALFLCVFIWVITVTIGAKIFEPGKQELEDFDYTDVAFSRSFTTNDSLDPNIVIINSGNAGRAEIAAIINKVNTMAPRAIGVDIIFKHPKDAATDDSLARAISASHNIVLASEISKKAKTEYGVFKANTAHSGYANFFGKPNFVTRNFSPFYQANDTSFGAAVVNIVSPGHFQRLYERNRKYELINYSRTDKEYRKYNYQALLAGRIDTDALKDKIVLIGLCDDNNQSVEDKHFTPMNEHLLAKSLPDMHGVVIQANIISMILSSDYINPTPGWAAFLFSLIVIWICVAAFIFCIAREYKLFHFLVKVAQSLIILALSIADIWMLHSYNYKSDLLFLMLVVIMSVEVLHVYEWLVTRKAFKKMVAGKFVQRLLSYKIVRKIFVYESIFKHH